jgi:hypothetical protein
MAANMGLIAKNLMPLKVTDDAQSKPCIRNQNKIPLAAIAQEKW